MNEVYALDESLPTNLVEEWTALVLSHGGSFFQTPLWIRSWWDTVAGRPPTEIRCWRDESGRLAAIAARSAVRERLHRRIPVRIRYTTNSGTGVGAADHAGWCGDDIWRRPALAWLGEHSIARPALLQSLPAHAAPSGVVEVARRRCPRVDVENYLSGRAGSTKLHKQIRYNRRRLREQGITFDFAGCGDIDGPLLEHLIRLHGNRREMAGDVTVFDESRLPLHYRLAQESTTSIGTAAVVATDGVEPVAMLYCLVCADTVSYFQSGWDPRLASYSIGSVLVDEAIRRAGDLHASTFDFLRGPEDYKYRFGAIDVVDVDVLLGTGPLAWALRAKRSRKRTDGNEGT